MISVGDTITPFVRLGSFEAWSRYGAVNYEIAGHHIDDEVARHEGFPAAFAMAPLTFSYFQIMLREWIGDAGRVETVEMRLRSPFYRGRTLTVTGTVTSVAAAAGGGVRIEADVWADDDEGTRIAEGRAVVVSGPTDA